ncbi:histidinol dehydrogenase [Hypnocyclicus thermotrophus]|uniref:Histidinol dehydrogenase n=1 Tax=Hypnocyclicus thermotrophus TaxID=1627895 RepID=A0AA46I5T3_9FUSO|nr:histidinol dehydrogenase [Hypnocyclicus thermotrophus]TDT71459.1 histidinol dehydrogenase [Hypnocyclicus thermotrophus]
MIKIVSYKDNKFILDEILNNTTQFEYDEVNKAVIEILKNIKENGDKAVLEYNEKFDGVKLNSLQVTKQEIDEAYFDNISLELRNSLELAHKKIKEFHEKQKRNSFIDTNTPNKIVGQLINPIEKVGIYVPGGTASYPSTVLMNAVPAKIAGCKEIIMVTPPGKNGKVPANILAAAKIAGIDKIFKVGGAQAIGALSFGTETIPNVYKIVGPGNIYVAMAKKMVYGQIDIDMIAGPSEVLIIADKTANYRYLAADLLSQAEHDKFATSILVTTSEELAKKVQKEIEIQLNQLPRKEIAETSINNQGRIIIVNDIKDACYIANKIAPEHLELAVKNPFEILGYIKNAGAIFMGEYSPEPLGDYMAGPNHTLPTSGTAKFSSPLGVDDFIKKSSIIYYDKNALKELKNDIINIATSEGLDAHANSIKIRFEDK